MQQPDSSHRCVIVGDACVGKTVMLARFCGVEIPSDFVPSIIEEQPKTFNDRGQIVQLTVVDTAGYEEEFDRLRRVAYTRAEIFLLCFALNNRGSFENVSSIWIPELRGSRPDVPIVLVGMKLDLCPQERRVTRQEAEQLRASIGASAYVECSGLENRGVTEVFEAAVRVLLEGGQASKQSKRTRRWKKCSIL